MLNKQGFNFKYVIDCTYDTYYDCANGSDCCDDDYCRCGVLENIQVKDFKLDKAVLDLIKMNRDAPYLFDGKELPFSINKNQDFLPYCIERILSLNGGRDKNNWYGEAEGGYYGQELHGVFLKNHEKYIDETIKLLQLETPKEMLEFILELEYGFVLESIKDVEWVIATINKADIVFGQQDYSHKLNREYVEGYKDYLFPRGLVLEDVGSKYKIIDGYHRISAAPDDKIEVICGMQ